MEQRNIPNEENRIYAAIDLKSFYASVECMERGLDPLTTNLLVADDSRTDKTICLAVSPSLKSYGISGRARLFEAKQKIKEVNAMRTQKLGRPLEGEPSSDAIYLSEHPEAPVGFITAVPRMAYYIEYSTRIYDIYLNYVAPEDIHVYSVDEVFIDITGYLKLHNATPRELVMRMIQHVLRETGITATAGIGTNMYLAKIAMDIGAKHIPADKDGVRIAELDEMKYRETLWDHKPITDFWRVGKGYAKRLASCGLYTMGDVARCSIGAESDFHNEELLYKLFGINAELLIDHAWGWEPCTISEIKKYKPKRNSLSSGQVLQEPYPYEKAKLIVKEMVDSVALNLTAQGLVCNQVTLTIGYDIENLTDPERRRKYQGEVVADYYGRQVPKHAHGTASLGEYTSSAKLLTDGVLSIFDRTVDPNLLVRRVTIDVHDVKTKDRAEKEKEPEQLSLFGSLAEETKEKLGVNPEGPSEEELKDEASIQEALIKIKEKFGRNAVVKAMDLEEGATAMDRNKQIGGHKA